MTDIVELFAGPGGWSTGLCNLQMDDSVEGIEWDVDACNTARAAGFSRMTVDVATITPQQFAGATALIASPPCQGFSLAGKGKGRDDYELITSAVELIGAGHDPRAVFASEMSDPRSILIVEPLIWALGLQPEWMAWEQVPLVLPLWEACADVLRDHGYWTWTGILNAEQYGVPQTRRRAILLANRLGPVSPPVATHSRFYSHSPEQLDPGVKKWVSMADALGWGMTERPYPAVAAGTAAGGTDPQAIGGSGARRTILTEKTAGRWVSKSWHDGPETWSHPFAGRSELSAAATLTGNKNDGMRVSIAEAGVLQSFPSDYPWRGAKSSQFQQVGNACPPKLCEAVLVAAQAVVPMGAVA